MKTVRDIFVDALSLKRQGLRAREIADRLIHIGHESGFPDINEASDAQVIELTFPNQEMIRFDGTDWHHVRP